MSNVCAISGIIKTLAGDPASGQQVIFSIKSTYDDQGGQLAAYTPVAEEVPVCVGVTSDAVTVFTDQNGAFDVDLLKGSRVLLEIPGINLRKEIKVPDADDADFADLI